MTDEIVKNVRAHGYYLAEGFIKDIDAFRAEVMAIQQQRIDCGDIQTTENSIKTCSLVRSRLVQDLLAGEVITSINEKLIGPRYKIGGLVINCVLPWSAGMCWHRDHPYLTVPPSYFDSDDKEQLGVLYLIALDDFNPTNGATRFMPGSHRQNQRPQMEEKTVMLRKGDALVMHGGIWHSVDKNTSDDMRSTLLINFHPWWVRTFNTPQQVAGLDIDLEALPERIRQLLIVDKET